MWFIAYSYLQKIRIFTNDVSTLCLMMLKKIRKASLITNFNAYFFLKLFSTQYMWIPRIHNQRTPLQAYSYSNHNLPMKNRKVNNCQKKQYRHASLHNFYFSTLFYLKKRIIELGIKDIVFLKVPFILPLISVEEW